MGGGGACSTKKNKSLRAGGGVLRSLRPKKETTSVAGSIIEFSTEAGEGESKRFFGACYALCELQAAQIAVGGA